MSGMFDWLRRREPDGRPAEAQTFEELRAKYERPDGSWIVPSEELTPEFKRRLEREMMERGAPPLTAQQAARKTGEAVEGKYHNTELRKRVYAAIEDAAAQGLTMVELRQAMGEIAYRDKALVSMVTVDLERAGYGVVAGTVLWGWLAKGGAHRWR